MAQAQCAALFAGRGALRPSDVEWDGAVGGDDHGAQHRLAAQSSHGVDVDRGAVVQFTDRVVVLPEQQGVFVNEHDDLGNTRVHRHVTARDESGEGVRGEELSIRRQRIARIVTGHE